MWQFLSGKMPAVCFDGAGIYIRPPHPRDIGQWVELRRTSGPFLIPWEPAWPADASTPAAFRRRFRRFREEWRAGCGFAFFIFEQEGDRLVVDVPQIHLHYCDTHRLDRLHAERLREVPNVHLHPHPEGGHRLVTILRDTGRLRSILEDALAPPA